MGFIALPKRYKGRDGEWHAESDIDWLFRIYDLGVPVMLGVPHKAYEDAVRGFLNEHYKVVRGKGKGRWLPVRFQADSELPVANYDVVWNVFRKLHKAIDRDVRAYCEYTNLMRACEDSLLPANTGDLEEKIELGEGGGCGCMGYRED